MLRRLPKPVFVALLPAAIALALYLVYRLIDPLPPRHFAIAAGIAATTYDDLARQYARILARNGVELEVRNYASAVEDLNVLRDAASGVQAGITTFGFTESRDPETMYSLGGISDSPIFIFYRNAEPITQFVQFRGKRLSIGTPTTALRQLMLEVLKATGALDDSIRLVDLDFAESIDALVAGEIDATMLPAQLGDKLLERALAVPNVRIMNVAQAEAISKTVPGLKHVVLSRGLVSLARDIPDSDVNLLAIRNRVLVRKNLHPALQYLLLEAMREVHWPPGPFNRLGEFPAEQPNDLPLSPTAEAFYRSGGSFWQRYTSFWLTSLLDRIVFFVVPVVAIFIPLVGFAPRVYRWLHVRHINQLHRDLGNVERDLGRNAGASQLAQYEKRVREIESAVRSLKVAHSFELDLHRLRIHLHMVQEDLGRMAASSPHAATQEALGATEAGSRGSDNGKPVGA